MKTRSLIPTEHQIQAAVVAWRDAMVNGLPLLALLHAIPNGAGVRHKKVVSRSGRVLRISPEANKLRKEGLTKGMPDMHWPVPVSIPSGMWIGLWIEHKRPGGKGVDDDQARIIALLRRHNHLVVVSKDAQFSIDVLQHYNLLMLLDRGPQYAQTLSHLNSWNQGVEPWPRKTPQ